MLEQVMSEIRRTPYISYTEFFAEYVMDVQDRQLEDEISFVLKNNELDVKSLHRLIDEDLYCTKY